MSIHEMTIEKIQGLPEPLVQEVSDFIDFLVATVSLNLSGADFCDYLTNLESYEERLARGEIQW